MQLKIVASCSIGRVRGASNGRTYHPMLIIPHILGRPGGITIARGAARKKEDEEEEEDGGAEEQEARGRSRGGEVKEEGRERRESGEQERIWAWKKRDGAGLGAPHFPAVLCFKFWRFCFSSLRLRFWEESAPPAAAAE